MESGVGRWGQCLLPHLHRNLVLASGERERRVSTSMVWCGVERTWAVETGWRETLCWLVERRVLIIVV